MHLLYHAALAVAAIAGLAAPAFASCDGGRFAGPYIGLTAGIGTLDSRQTSPLETIDAKSHATRFVPGAVLGYDIQCDRTVAGIVGDISYLGFKTDSGWPLDGIGTRSKIDMYETLRGKLGLTLRDDLLLYGTAGLAFANVTSTLTSAAPSPVFTQTDKHGKTGFVWGGGLEFARSDRMKWNAEALHVGLGHESYDYNCLVGCSASADWKNSFWVARLGLTITLGSPVVEHTPLK